MGGCGEEIGDEGRVKLRSQDTGEKIYTDPNYSF